MTWDLHSHSTRSDGRLTPSALLERAGLAGLKAFALTDHDTLAGLPEAAEAAEAAGVRLVPGIEISTHFDGRGLHLLAFWGAMGAWSSEFEALLERRLEGRRARLRAMAEALAEHGVALDVERVERGADGAVTRAHVAEELVRTGAVRSKQQAFDRWIGVGKPGFVSSEKFPTEEAIALVRAEGGIPVVAHPGERELDRAELKTLAEAGLGGVEAVHPCHGRRHRMEYRRWARELDLVVTAGSDFHGHAGARLLRRGEGLKAHEWEAFAERL